MALWKKQGSKQAYLDSPLRELEEGIFTEAWNARGGGMWAGLFGAGYGAVAGAVIGGVATFLNPAAGVQLLLGSIGVASISGLLIGRASGAENGSAAGAAVGSTRVILSEMRQKFKGLEHDMSAIKQKLGIPNDPDFEKKQAQEPLAETQATGNKKGYWEGGTKTLIFALAVGAALGAIALASSYALNLNNNASVFKEVLDYMGFGASKTTKFIGATLIGAGTAGVFAFNVPLVTTKFHMLGRQINSGWLFEKKGKEPQKAPAVEQQVATAQQNVQEHEQPQKNFAESITKKQTVAVILSGQQVADEPVQLER